MNKLNLRLLMWIIIIIASVKLLYLFVSHPYGAWDAWSIWNPSALFLYHSSPHQFSTELSHPDYPLLLPFIVATGWRLIGSTNPIVPVLVAGGFTIALVGLLFDTLRRFAGTDIARLLIIVLIIPSYIVINGAGQTADIPLAFFMLACNVCILFYERMENQNALWIILSGVLTGLALHTKNEGILFALVLVIYLLMGEGRWKRLALFGAGIAPFLIALLYFKLVLAPPNDIIAGANDIPLWGKFLDLERYFAISFYLITATGSQIFLSLIVIGFAHDGAKYSFVPDKLFIQCGLILAGYLVIYLITPHDIWWHLNQSIHRLILHIYPIFLLALGLSLKPARQQV